MSLEVKKITLEIFVQVSYNKKISPKSIAGVINSYFKTIYSGMLFILPEGKDINKYNFHYEI